MTKATMTIEEMLAVVSKNPKHHLWPSIVDHMVNALLEEYNFLTPGWGTWREIAIDWLVSGSVCEQRYQLGDHHLQAIKECWEPYIPFQQYE